MKDKTGWSRFTKMNCFHLVFCVGKRTLKFFLHILKAFVYVWTYRTIRDNKQILPKIKNDLLFLSASELADKIRNKEVKCADVVEAYIQRINEVNPILNSVIDERFDNAREEAKAIDEMVLSEPEASYSKMRKPLLGVPLTVKETIPVKGLSNNAARSRVASNTALEDAKVVQLLKEVGVIPLVVTNIPELCLNWETFNPKHGTTNNPYDTRRTPGGSSGGEGALLGAGASVIGIGSDLAGSIRLPALFCGVFGHKPTPGYIPIDGHIPSSKDLDWKSCFVVGPLTRYARDLPVMVKAMIPKDKIQELRLDDPVDIHKLNVFYMDAESDHVFSDSISKDMKEALHKAVYHLETGYKLKTQMVNIREAKNFYYFAQVLLRIELTDDELPRDWSSKFAELGKKLLNKSSVCLNAAVLPFLQSLVRTVPDKQVEKLKRKNKELKSVFEEILGDNGVLLYPTYTQAATFHSHMIYQPFNNTFMTLFTFLGFPVTQCPVGLNKEGLPVGVQIVASSRQDRLCMAVAKALEDSCGGWTPPTMN